MRIKEINIVNFKGFENKTIRFHDNLTVVIGNNTSGKTTLLKAIQVGLGAYLQSLSSLPGGKKFRRNFSKSDIYKFFDSKLRSYESNEEETQISILADFLIPNSDSEFKFKPIKWRREYTGNYTRHTRAIAGELIDAVESLEHQRKEGDIQPIYPLLLSFGANRITDEQMRKIGRKRKRTSRLENAYKDALHDKVDFNSASKWLSHYDKDIKDKKEFEGTREAFFESLQLAIPALSEVDFDEGEIEAVVSVAGREPSRHHLSYMSDGLQAMINIVSGIAYRCIELNGFLGEEAISKTPGVVLIDEVDLYLHPHWQRHVLQDLRKAFPMIQFIVSTHSPFIVQSLDENQLISFDENALVSGRPYQEGLEDISAERMGLEDQLRSRKFLLMEKKASAFLQMVKEHKVGKLERDRLKEELTKLQSEFSENPAYLALLKMESGL